MVVWLLRGTVSEEREARALRLIAVTFCALAAYLAVESVTDLASQHRPEQSTAGMAVTAAALVVMPLLAVAKRSLRPGSARVRRWSLRASRWVVALCGGRSPFVGCQSG